MYIAYLRQDSDRLYDLGIMSEPVNAGVDNMAAVDETYAEPDASMSNTPPPEPVHGTASPDVPAPTGVTHSLPDTPTVSKESPTTTTTEPETSPPAAPSESAESPLPTEPLDLSAFNDRVIVVGCSVLLGARSALRDAIPGSVVDAEGSRQMWQGYEYIMRLQEAGTLPEFVVIALGTNANENSFDFIEKIIADIAPGHRLIFVTPYNGQGGERSVTFRTAVYIRALPEQYDFVTVADWSAAIMPNPRAIGADKIHIGGNAAGIEIFVNCVIDALYVSGTRPAKL